MQSNLDRVFDTMPQPADAQSQARQLMRDLEWARESVERQINLSRRIESAMRPQPPFDHFFVHDTYWNYFHRPVNPNDELSHAAERIREDELLVSIELPKRGWYLSGQEDCRFFDELAILVRTKDLDQVDCKIMGHLPSFNLDALREWLHERGIPPYCSNRVALFMTHHRDGNHEEATFLGVPLLDEIAKYLYSDKAFTTKRGNPRNKNQNRPEIAIATANGPDLEPFCARFVSTFGSLQSDTDPTLLEDENYWNRHAMVHGQMRRAMGAKDSAKCLMALSFLIFARRKSDEQDAVEQDD